MKWKISAVPSEYSESHTEGEEAPCRASLVHFYSQVFVFQACEILPDCFSQYCCDSTCPLLIIPPIQRKADLMK